MCLLTMISRVRPGWPLILAANRDEFFTRPARPMTVLQPRDPRILGGLDERGGGTWAAINEHGVVAALTNRPTSGPPDPARRSRGELPLLLAAHPTADQAVRAFVSSVQPARYNPCWLLVGDRSSLHYIELEDRHAAPVARVLPAGIHVLENAPLERPSAKTRRVTAALSRHLDCTEPELLARLRQVLSDHEIATDDTAQRRAAFLAATCVHSPLYGTRSALAVRLPQAPGRPLVCFTDGPPCERPWVDASGLWV